MVSILLLGLVLSTEASQPTYLDGLLILAVEAGDAEEVARLLSRGADPNARQTGENEADFARNTALILATRVERPDMVRELLAAGASVDSKNDLNATALMFAVSSGSLPSLEILDILVAARANVTGFQGVLGRNPILNALAYGNTAAVKILIDAGADVNAQGGEGETLSPLMLAAARGFAEVCEWLIGAGAQVNARSEEDGRTALDYAMGQKQTIIIQLLRKRGGKRALELDAANPREQRTRSPRSARHSPLPRHPLGGNKGNSGGLAGVQIAGYSDVLRPGYDLRRFLPVGGHGGAHRSVVPSGGTFGTSKLSACGQPLSRHQPRAGRLCRALNAALVPLVGPGVRCDYDGFAGRRFDVRYRCRRSRALSPGPEGVIPMPPNPSVQRTRSSPSARRWPLTRRRPAAKHRIMSRGGASHARE